MLVGEGVALLLGPADGDGLGVAVLARVTVGDGDNVALGDAVTTRAVGDGGGDDVGVGDGDDAGPGVAAMGDATMTAVTMLGVGLAFVATSATGLVSCTGSPSAIRKLRTVNIIVVTSARVARIAFCVFVTPSLSSQDHLRSRLSLSNQDTGSTLRGRKLAT